jgi:hypothetical protein
MKFCNIIVVTALLYGTACWAQSSSSTSAASTQAINAQNANNLCRVYFVKPKPGAEQQLEAGRKKHMQFHRSQKDTWTWNTWSIETGDNTGSYVTSSCGHAWKDFDEWEKRMGKIDAADATANMAAYQQGSSNGFYLYRADLSLGPPNQAPAPMTAVTIYVLHPGTAPDFIAAIKKINDALSKQPDWPKTSGWLQLVNGGEGPTFVLLSARQNWADFTPLQKSVPDVLNEVYGKEAADQIFKTIRDCTNHLFTETALYRPELSYVAGK